MNAFVAASITSSRLVKEQATSLPARASVSPTQVSINADTSSSFTLGVDSETDPKEFGIEINFKATIRLQADQKEIASYEAVHAVQFRVSGWTGFEKWNAVPPEAMEPYLGVAHSLAAHRAEGTFAAMGMRGVVLPKPDAFATGQVAKPESQPGETTKASSVEPMAR